MPAAKADIVHYVPCGAGKSARRTGHRPASLMQGNSPQRRTAEPWAQRSAQACLPWASSERLRE